MRATACLALLSIACGPSAALEDAGRDAAIETALPPPPPAEPGRHDVSIVETRRVVPSDGLPLQTEALTSNNVIAGESPDELVVYDYSSDVDDPETPRLTWREGQSGATYVYRSVLRFTPRP